MRIRTKRHQVQDCGAETEIVMKSRIHHTKPSITEREIEYANDAVSNGWGPRCYEYIARFEEAFKSISV